MKRGQGCGRYIGGRAGSGPCGEVGLCSSCWGKAEDADRDRDSLDAMLQEVEPA